MNRTKNRIVFKITTGYKLEILTPETMKLLGSTNEDVDKDKNGKNVPKIESVEVVSVDFNLVKNDYQHTPKVLFTFIPNKQFGQLTNISPHSLTIMKTVNIKLFSVEVWFTDQISKSLEIEDNANLKLIIGQDIIKRRYSLEPKYRKYVKGYGFSTFAKKFGDKYYKKLIDTAT